MEYLKSIGVMLLKLIAAIPTNAVLHLKIIELEKQIATLKDENTNLKEALAKEQIKNDRVNNDLRECHDNLKRIEQDEVNELNASLPQED